MGYQDHYQHADAIVAHLDTLVPGLADPLLRAKYTGFVTVAAVTVYEMAVKDVFIDFASQTHPVLGSFADSFFDRINGRIQLDDLKKYAARFGQAYADTFIARLKDSSEQHLKAAKRDPRSAYSNLVLWRHDFAHEAIAASATYQEAVTAYQDGKVVIECLAFAMQ